MKTNGQQLGKGRGDGGAAFGMRRKGFAFKQKNKRLGGKGLSLEAFASAKTTPLITPSQIRERREFYQNAKKVTKYKKLMKRMSEQSSSLHGVNVQDSNANVVQILHQNKLPRDSSSLAQNKDVKGISPTKQAFMVPGSRVKPSANLKKQKSMSSLEKLRHEYEKERMELEKVRKEEEATFASQQEARERARQIRKDGQLKMRKKTSTGQPVMKHRLEHLLEKIQRT